MARKRNQEIKVFLDEDELKHLNIKMARAGYSNRSQYVRKMILDGYIIQINATPVKALLYEVNKIGVNVNQFMHLIHARNLVGDTIEQEDLEKLKKLLSDVYEKVASAIELMID